MKKAFDIVGQIIVAVGAVVVAVEDAGHPDGPAKKAAATAKVMEMLKPVLPDFVEPILPPLLSLLIDWAVSQAHANGFFVSSATP